MNEQEFYDKTMQALTETKDNKTIYQLKLTSGEDIVAIRAKVMDSEDAWINPVKIHYIRDMAGRTNLMLNSWFITSKKHYHVKIEPQQIISKMVVDRGMAEYYRKVNDAAVEGELQGEEEFIEELERTKQAHKDSNPTKKYQDPDIERKMVSAMEEGRWFPFANAQMTTH